MEVQKHGRQGRSYLFDLAFRVRQSKTTPDSTTATQVSTKGQALSTQTGTKRQGYHWRKVLLQVRPKPPTCWCCAQAQLPCRCEEFNRKSVPERFEIVKNMRCALAV